MLRIHIGSITDQGIDLDEQVDADMLPLLKTLSNEESVRFARPVHVRVHASLTGETFLVKGAVETVVRIPCSRCLEPFDSNITTDFSAAAVPEIPSMADGEIASETELTADEIEVIAYSGNIIDLRDEIAQQIIMALPIKPLCRDTCMGLCNRCGANLNKTSCQCDPLDENGPFAALKKLSLPEKRE